MTYTYTPTDVYLFPGMTYRPARSHAKECEKILQKVVQFYWNHTPWYKLTYKQLPNLYKALQSKSRKKELVEIRHVYCYLCDIHVPMATYKNISSLIGDRNHSTLIKGIARIQDLLDTEQKITQKDITNKIQSIDI